MIETVKNKVYQHRHLLCILTLIAFNFIIFREHYLGHLIFRGDFSGGYHYHAVNWYLDSSLCNQAQYIPWLSGGFPAAWMFQNSSYYLPLQLLDWLEITYTLHLAVIIQCLHYLFAMVGVYILLLRLKPSAVTALIAALIYGTG
ncbi:MAG: hypothetical protein D3908_16190, partial [Candidatus Electrothrix sp. AUS4]|nr:hypothetical protein [Candidatus Electrothrix sp. AUS4]